LHHCCCDYVKTYPDYEKLILRVIETIYLIQTKFSTMIKEDKKNIAIKYSNDLNRFIIKLKKEVLKGNITSISLEEIDEATIPALNILRNQKHLD
jgi:hypothetical protein